MLPSLRSPEALLQRLEWRILRRLDGLLQGDYQSFFRGFGLDLAELREYQYHDDVRYIDWNVTARVQIPHVRQYNEDREVTAWFLLDLSPSVDFGPTDALKRNLLIDFVGVLARLLTRRGNRVGAVMYGGGIQAVVPARPGRLQVLHLLDRLLAQPRLRRSPPTDLGALLEAAYRLIQRRSLVFLVSDFFSLPGWGRPLGILAQRHELLAVRLVDPREIELPDIGPVVMEDAESGEQIYLDTHDPGFRERFLRASRRREQELRGAFAAAGVDVLTLSTEGDLLKALFQFSSLRKRRATARQGPARAATAPAAPRERSKI